MTEENNPYREGDEPEPKAVETVGTATDEHEDTVSRIGDPVPAPQYPVPEPEKLEEPEQPVQVIPITAFIVAKLPNKTEVLLDMPGFKMEHRASLDEVRDMAIGAHDDAQLALTAKRSARIFLEAITTAQQAQQEKPRIIQPLGASRRKHR